MANCELASLLIAECNFVSWMAAKLLLLAMSHEPLAISHEPLAISH
jgi:hypothetical protein